MNTFLDTSAFRMQEPPMTDKDVDSFYDILTKGKKQTFLCKLPDCGKIFRYKSEIIRHIATHSNNRPHVCTHDGCKKSFKRADALENHVRTHTKETPFACTTPGCDLMFTTKASLRYHVLKHKNQKIYKCSFPECNKAFITVFQLKQHEKSACIHKKQKDKDLGDNIYDETNESESHNTAMPMAEKEPVIQTGRAKHMEWNYKQQQVLVPSMEKPQVQQVPQMQMPFDHNVRDILTENQILKKRLEVSQKIINLLQQKNEQIPYMEQNSDALPDAAQFFYRQQLFQGQMFE